MPWDSVDKYRDEEFWPPRGRRKNERTEDSPVPSVQDVSCNGLQSCGCPSEDDQLPKDREDV